MIIDQLPSVSYPFMQCKMGHKTRHLLLLGTIYSREGGLVFGDILQLFNPVQSGLCPISIVWGLRRNSTICALFITKLDQVVV